MDFEIICSLNLDLMLRQHSSFFYILVKFITEIHKYPVKPFINLGLLTAYLVSDSKSERAQDFILRVLWSLRRTFIDMFSLMIKIVVLRSIFHLLLKHCICLGQILLKNGSKLTDYYFEANESILDCGTLVLLISLYQSWMHTSEA